MEPAKEAISSNLPWVEKYRPSSLDQLVSHQDIISTIQRFIAEDRLPHLLFYGPPGTGKTSTIKACATQLYGKNYKSMVLELNASDDRGIDVVRDQIKTFASTKNPFNKGYKLIILDEADAMTQDAQAALRRVIEKFTRNVRFCMTCNYVSKIIPALQSRCTRFRFSPLSEEQMKLQVQRTIDHERLEVTEGGLNGLIRLSTGDMRKALNILQSTSMAFSVIDEASVYACTGKPLESDIASIMEWMLNEPFSISYQKVEHMKTLKGLALQDILTEVHSFIHRVDFPPKIRIFLLEKIGEIEERIAAGTSEKLQLSSLIAAFQRVRVMAGQEV